MTRLLLFSALCFSLLSTPDSQVSSMAAEEDEPAGFPLTIEIQMPQTKISRQDSLIVEGKVKNAGKVDRFYYPTAQPALQFQEKDSKQIWVTQASLFPPPPGAPPRRLTWKSGEETKFTISLGPQTKYAHAEAKPDTARIGLPPGKYLLHLKMTYLDHYRDQNANAIEGMLAPKPIEFEVVGK